MDLTLLTAAWRPDLGRQSTPRAASLLVEPFTSMEHAPASPHPPIPPPSKDALALMLTAAGWPAMIAVWRQAVAVGCVWPGAWLAGRRRVLGVAR